MPSSGKSEVNNARRRILKGVRTWVLEELPSILTPPHARELGITTKSATLREYIRIFSILWSPACQCARIGGLPGQGLHHKSLITNPSFAQLSQGSQTSVSSRMSLMSSVRMASAYILSPKNDRLGEMRTRQVLGRASGKAERLNGALMFSHCLRVSYSDESSLYPTLMKSFLLRKQYFMPVTFTA
jgi:hypothetical protein